MKLLFLFYIILIFYNFDIALGSDNIDSTTTNSWNVDNTNVQNTENLTTNLIDEEQVEMNDPKAKLLNQFFQELQLKDFTQEKFEEIKSELKQSILEHHLVFKDEEIIEYLIEKKYGNKIKYADIMKSTDSFYWIAVFTTVFNFLFIELPALCNWRDVIMAANPHKFVWQIEIGMLPMTLFTIWSALAIVPFILKSNPFLMYDIKIDDFLKKDVQEILPLYEDTVLVPDNTCNTISELNEEEKKIVDENEYLDSLGFNRQTFKSWLKLKDLGKTLSGLGHMMEIYLSGNQLRRGFTSFVIAGLITHYLLNIMLDYVGVAYIPPNSNILYFFHRLLLCIRAWSLDDFGLAQRWFDAYNGKHIPFSAELNVWFTKKLPADGVLALSGLVMKFFKGFVVGLAVRIGTWRCMQGPKKVFKDIFCQEFDPTLNWKTTMGQMVSPLMTLFNLILMFVSVSFALTGETVISNDWADFACIPFFVMMLIPLPPLITSLSILQLKSNLKKNFELPCGKCSEIKNWVKKNDILLMGHSIFTMVYAGLCYGLIGVKSFTQWYQTIGNFFYFNAIFYYGFFLIIDASLKFTNKIGRVQEKYQISKIEAAKYEMDRIAKGYKFSWKILGMNFLFLFTFLFTCYAAYSNISNGEFLE